MYKTSRTKALLVCIQVLRTVAVVGAGVGGGGPRSRSTVFVCVMVEGGGSGMRLAYLGGACTSPDARMGKFKAYLPCTGTRPRHLALPPAAYL